MFLYYYLRYYAERLLVPAFGKDFKMAEAVAQQMARLLQAQFQMRPSVTNDLSLVSLIPRWVGTDKAVPLH